MGSVQQRFSNEQYRWTGNPDLAASLTRIVAKFKIAEIVNYPRKTAFKIGHMAEVVS